MRSIAAPGLLLLLGLACSSPKSATTPLTDTQQADLRATLHSAGRIFTAAGLAKRQMSGLNILPASNYTDDAVVARMEARLEAAHCDISIAHPADPGYQPSDLVVWIGGFPKNFQMAAGGGGCPATLGLRVKSNSLGQNAEGVVDARFQGDFGDINDITGFQFQGKVALEPQGDLTHAKYHAHADSQGTLFSRAHGELPLRLFGEGDIEKFQDHRTYGKLTLTLRVDFPDYAAELKQIDTFTGNDLPEEQFTLNGQAISRETYYAIFESSGGGLNAWPVFYQFPGQVDNDH